MSETSNHEHMTDDTAGRHRGEAAPEEAERAQPHGKHRRPSDD